MSGLQLEESYYAQVKRIYVCDAVIPPYSSFAGAGYPFRAFALVSDMCAV